MSPSPKSTSPIDTDTDSIPSSSPPQIFSSSQPVAPSSQPSSPSCSQELQSDGNPGNSEKEEKPAILTSLPEERPSTSSTTLKTHHIPGEADQHDKIDKKRALEDEADVYSAPEPKKIKLDASLVRKSKPKGFIPPFRSPLVKSSPTSGLDTRTKSRLIQSMQQPSSSSTTLALPTFANKKTHHTPRASAQFKSPFGTISSSSTISTPTKPDLQLGSTIQSLERRKINLKRALKIQSDDEEKVLAELATKWRLAAREVAYEVWALVEQSPSSEAASIAARGDANGWGSGADEKKQGWGWGAGSAEKQGNWGWDDSAERHGGGWGWDDPAPKSKGDQENEEEEQPQEEHAAAEQQTLGTMLKQLGVDPQTLGWNEDAEDFVD